MHHPIRIQRKPGIPTQLLPTQHRANAAKLRVIPPRHRNRPIPRMKNLIRHNGRMRIPMPRRITPRRQMRHRLVRHRRHLHIQQRNIDPLPNSRPRALMQRRQYPRRRVHPRKQIRHGHARAHRRPIHLPRNPHQPAHALHDKIIPRPRRIRPCLPKPRNRTINQPRINRPQILPPQPILCQTPNLEILHEHIALRRHLAHNRRPRRVRDIDRHRHLPAIGRHEIRGHPHAGAARCSPQMAAPNCACHRPRQVFRS